MRGRQFREARVSNWLAPVRLGLIAVAALVVFGSGFHLALALGGEQLARLEKAGKIAPFAISARQGLRQLEQRAPLVEALIMGGTPGDWMADARMARSVDRQMRLEYYTLLFLAWMAGCIWFVWAFWDFLFSVGMEFRKRQLRDRPAGARYPEFAEYCLYAGVWGEFDDAADFAEALRDRYVTEWEPEMGRFLASCWYVYEVAARTPWLWWRTGRRRRRRRMRG